MAGTTHLNDTPACAIRIQETAQLSSDGAKVLLHDFPCGRIDTGVHAKHRLLLDNLGDDHGHRAHVLVVKALRHLQVGYRGVAAHLLLLAGILL